MRLNISKSKNSTSLYVIKDFREGNKRSTKIVERLGTVSELSKTLNGQDPIEWAKEYIKELNRKEKEDSRTVLTKFSPNKQIEKDTQVSFNGGYLFLQKIYHQLGLDQICREITKRHKFEYDLSSILSRLLYARILYPASKLATKELSKRFIEQPAFELSHIYRALDVLCAESAFIHVCVNRKVSHNIIEK